MSNDQQFCFDCISITPDACDRRDIYSRYQYCDCFILNQSHGWTSPEWRPCHIVNKLHQRQVTIVLNTWYLSCSLWNGYCDILSTVNIYFAYHIKPITKWEQPNFDVEKLLLHSLVSHTLHVFRNHCVNLSHYRAFFYFNLLNCWWLS